MRFRVVRNFQISNVTLRNEWAGRNFSGFVPVAANKWSGKYEWKFSRNFERHESSQATIFPTAITSKNTIPVAKKNKWTPGPVETLLSLFKTEKAIKLHEYVDDNHKKLGPIFRDRIGPVNIVFVNSPADFRRIFLLEGRTPMHFLPEAWHYYNRLRNCSRGILFMDGEEWLRFRKIMNKVMLSPNPGEITIPRCNEVAHDLVEEWTKLADTSRPVEELEPRLYRWSIEGPLINLFISLDPVMLATLIGSSWKNYKPRIDQETMKLARILHRIFELSAKLSVLPVKYAIKFRLPVWQEFCQVADEALSSVRTIVSEILGIGGDGLMNLMIEKGITNEEDLVRIVTDLIIAAGDTTSYSTQWALFLLAKNPRVQDQLAESLKGLEEKDIEDNKYVRAIIRESLRLYPTAPFLTRFLPQDAIIAGHHVSKGELILMSIFTSGREADNFPKPNEFWPERWLRNEAGRYEGVANPHGSLPFALGARSCIGRKLAETQMIFALSQIVKAFRIECVNAEAIKMILHLISVPSEPIKLRLEKRRR